MAACPKVLSFSRLACRSDYNPVMGRLRWLPEPDWDRGDAKLRGRKGLTLEPNCVMHKCEYLRSSDDAISW